jgi:hypothetical protein
MSYYDEDCSTKIKPKLLAKMPFNFGTNGFHLLDIFVDMSPGLEFLKARGCLISVIHNRSTMFYTDCENCYNRYKQKYTENVAICNLKVFFDSIKDMEKREEKKQEPTKLRRLLDQLHDKDDDEDDEQTDSSKRAEDILKLIRSRQKPKNKKKKR